MEQVVVLVLAIITQEVWHTEMPVWGVFMAFAMAAVYLIPVGTVFAVANLNSNVLTVLGEIISGYLLPGKPIVMLVFKVIFEGLSSDYRKILRLMPVLRIYRA